MPEFQPINSKSGNLTAAAYDKATGTLQIQFKSGATYEYSSVSPDLFNRFQATFQSDDSSGQFFYQNIRSLPYRKI